ncbi:hypothetical protein N7468_002637 [Penicillium chermesinum]|uniref:Uncharacterized protein n=1 Tax=Penicillium chermesinum TaxID=63820 RepID=A0A9W9PIV6_9EURO|nr:uncharacterized protein N7468_002637 [Penicillium chermesinum]KAJ5247654.1 hypothetical protein N7468_002637 [Penicillium chermesinum]
MNHEHPSEFRSQKILTSHTVVRTIIALLEVLERVCLLISPEAIRAFKSLVFHFHLGFSFQFLPLRPTPLGELRVRSL